MREKERKRERERDKKKIFFSLHEEDKQKVAKINQFVFQKNNLLHLVRFLAYSVLQLACNAFHMNLSLILNRLNFIIEPVQHCAELLNQLCRSADI